MSTKYEILAGDQLVETRSDKSAAIAIADKLRKTEKVATLVRTTAGTVVYERKLRKPQINTPKYTRLDNGLGPVEIPAGYVVAYVRVRTGVAILRLEGGTDYLLMNTHTGETTEVATTREGGALMRDGWSLEA